MKEISAKREWSVLLHYSDGWLSDRSLVDDESFFLSKNGKHDKLAELRALYDALYVSPADGQDFAGCRFPGRAEFLSRELGRSTDELNLWQCSDLNNFMEQVNPVSVSIIFPFYHMNGPASMFGHTLLRFDAPGGAKLVSSAVTYAADYNKKDNGIAYAVKGATGLYPGRSQILPYHEKIREYDNINQRDIWEYKLNIGKEGARRMALHVFEIRNTWSRYFFFDENCSYNLLFIIEAAKPDVHLTDKFLWVIPADTMVVLAEEGLLGEMTYRPSQSSKMHHMLADKDSAMYKIAIASMEKGELQDYSELSDDEKAKLLDFWTSYTMFTNRTIKDNKLYNKRLINVLRKRAKIKATYDLDVKTPVEPLDGHEASRLKISVGARDGEVFEEINWHPALHMLDDDDDGYLPGSSLAFFDITVRHMDDEYTVQKLSFVDIYSLSPVNELFNPLSWRVNFGVVYEEELDDYAGFFHSGAGKTIYLFGGLLYGLGGVSLKAADKFEDNYSAGLAGELGYIKQMGKTKLMLSLEGVETLAGEELYDNYAKTSLTRYFLKNHSISVEYNKDLHDDEKDEYKLSYAVHF